MRAKTIAVLVAAGALLAPTCAQAHISIHPNTVPAGAFATLDVRVPGEQAGAYVKRIDVLFPAGFTGVSYENVPGWSVRVIERKLAKPIAQDGESIDTEVAQIAWTWNGPLGQAGDGQFVEFPVAVAIPSGASGKALEFKTIQRYSNGHVDRWIDPALGAEHPAPRINVTAKGGVVEDVAGDEAGPSAGETGARSDSESASVPATGVAESGDRASQSLGVGALIVGALALVIALAALAVSRGKR